MNQSNDPKKEQIQAIFNQYELATVEQLQRFGGYFKAGQIKHLEHGLIKGDNDLYHDHIAIPMLDSRLEICCLAMIAPIDQQKKVCFEPDYFASGAHVLGQPNATNDCYVVSDIESGYLLHNAYPNDVVLISMTDKNMPYVVKSWQGHGRLIVPVACHLMPEITALLSDLSYQCLSLSMDIACCSDVPEIKQLMLDADVTVFGEPNEDDISESQIESFIYQLAELSDIAYERKRTENAKLMGIRASVLDKLVKEAKAELEIKTAVLQCMKHVEPHHEPVDCVALLDELVTLVNRFIVCEPETANAVALWIVFSWCVDAFYIAPIACITAPVKRCGKTELLTLMGKLVKRPQEASFISPSALFRVVDEYQPTLLIDEADAFMSQDEDMRGLINLGHAKGKQVLRCVGDDNAVKGFNVFGAKVISGIGHLADTIRDRSIIMELRRKLRHEKRERQRYLGTAEIESLKSRLARWSDHIEHLKEVRPTLPEMINDRAQDNWEPLLAIASLASEGWFNKATQTAIVLSGVIKDEPTTSELLLADIQTVFDKRKCERIFTSVLIEELCNDEEAPWSSYNFKSKDKRITSRQLSNKLKEYKIKSKDIRMGNQVKKGYYKSDFVDAFKRYASIPPNLTATKLQTNDSDGFSDFLSATNNIRVADKKSLKDNNDKGCSVVAVKIPPPEANSKINEDVADKNQDSKQEDEDINQPARKDAYKDKFPPPNKFPEGEQVKIV